EVEDVVNFLKTQGEPEYLHDIIADDDDMDLPLAAPGGDEGGGPEPSGDDLYDQAVNLVLREGKVSVSFIQRYLQIGYNRAAR
ncbi:DNA translocase FtsK, partial [Escherichia coli]